MPTTAVSTTQAAELTTEQVTEPPISAPSTSAPSTTAAPSTVRWTTAEQQIVDVGNVFWDLIVRSVNGDVADPFDPEIPVFVAGPAYDVMIENAATAAATQTSTAGVGYITPVSVELLSAEATLVQCVIDSIDTINAAGDVIEPADVETTLWRVGLQRSGPQWRVVTFTRIGESCDLDPDDQYEIRDRPWQDA